MAASSSCEDNANMVDFDLTIEPMEEGNAVGQKRKQPTTSNVRDLPPQHPKQKKKKEIAPRSKVWDHFTKFGVALDKCTCNYCAKEYKCGSAKCGTSTLKSHNEKCQEYKNHLEREKQKNLTRVNNGDNAGGQLVAVGFSQDACRRATVKMVILDELSLSFVEGEGFRHFCQVACPRFVVPSRRTITRDIMELHLKEKSALKSLLNNQSVSLTTDIWTANTTTVSYMVVTAHFIDVGFQLHRRIISFKPVSDHKGETIAKQVESCLINWGIKKVFTITVDNATANDNAVRILKNNLGSWRDDPLLFHGEFMHVRCCAHILNLIVKDGLSDINDSVVSVRNAVKYVRSSNARFLAFEKRSELEKVTRGSLILDNNIRWNYTYLMLTAALKHRQAFDKMAAEDKLYDGYFQEDEKGQKRVGPPKNSDWENVRRLVRFLKIFYDSTLVFSASKSVTSSSCYNEICSLEMNLKSIISNSDVNLSKAALDMKKKFEKYWEDVEINKLLILASVFDPRSKMTFVTICLEKLHGKDSAKFTLMKDAVIEVLRRLYETYSASHSKRCSALASQSESGSVNQPSSLSESNSHDFLNLDGEEEFENLFSEYSQMVSEKGSLEETSNELDVYLMEKIEMPSRNRLGMHFDIASWWKGHSLKFPILAEMARDILAIPVSTVASESAFSTGGRILDPYRSCLTPHMLEALILTQDWLRSSLDSYAKAGLHQIVEETEFMDLISEEVRKLSNQQGDAW